MRKGIVALFLLLCFTTGAHAAECERLRADGVGTLHRCGRLHVGRLRGTPVERARAFGEWHRGLLSPDLVNYFAGKVEDQLAQEMPRSLSRVAALGYDQVVRLFFREAPAALREEIDAQAMGMGVDGQRVRRALALPDTAVLLNALGSLPGLDFLPSAGCTSAAQREEGGFVHGRNLDFAGTGIWDRHPLLLVIEPPAGSLELRHIVLGADGLLFGGITGVNEAGLTFSVHQNYTADAGLHGVPVALVGELVLREARTLADAERLLRRWRPPAQWTFVLSQLGTGEAWAVESSPTRLHVRRMEGRAFAQTNHALGAAARQVENAALGIQANSVFRLERAFASLGEGAASPRSLARLLAYQEDPDGFLSAHHDVLKAHTIQSVIFHARPGAHDLYLSVDDAPTAGGRYARFSLEELWKSENAPRFELVDLAGTPPSRRARQTEIAEAFRAYFDEHAPARAAALLAGHPTLGAALFRAAAAYAEGSFAGAAGLAEAALQEPRFASGPAHLRESLEHVRLASLWRGGKSGEARALARQLIARPPLHPRVARLAAQIADGRSPGFWRLRLDFDFFSGDLDDRKR